MKKVKIYHASMEEDWEAEGFFTKEGKLLGCWHGNDGNWRREYFDGFLEELGIEVVYNQETPKMLEQLKEHTGG